SASHAHHGGGHQGGGAEEERGPWWKRKKDKKNKRKERQQHGGRSGGPQHPPQPPPPVLVPQHHGDSPGPARFAGLAALDTLAAALETGNGEATAIRIDEIYSLNLFELTQFARRLEVAFEGSPNRLQMLEAI